MGIDVVPMSIATEIGVWVGSITAAIFMLNRVWRTLGRTRVSDSQNRAEINMMELLQKENDILRRRADQFAQERNEAQRELGGLRAQVESLREALADCRDQLQGLRDEIEQLRRKQSGHD